MAKAIPQFSIRLLLGLFLTAIVFSITAQAQSFGTIRTETTVRENERNQRNQGNNIIIDSNNCYGCTFYNLPLPPQNNCYRGNCSSGMGYQIEYQGSRFGIRIGNTSHPGARPPHRPPPQWQPLPPQQPCPDQDRSSRPPVGRRLILPR